MSKYNFDRYVDGRLMAEGVGIDRESTLDDAIAKAVKIAPSAKGVTVLVHKSVTEPQLPQDVEEFIDYYARTPATINPASEVIFADDLSAWMAGHVRVPVEKMQAIQAGFQEAATEVLGWGAYASEYFQKKHGLTDSAAVFTQMADDIGNLLNASKGE